MGNILGPSATAEDVQKARDEYLNMKLEDKRKLYKCGLKYFPLDQIPTWKEYFVKNQVKPMITPPLGETKYEASNMLNCKVSLWEGDITTLEIDAIVNAARPTLYPGQGVDKAINTAAGAQLWDETSFLNGCPVGQAKIVCGYKLPAKYVIHACGPNGVYPQILQNAYTNSLDRLLENKLRSIAFPCLSTGDFGYPCGTAAHVALRTVRKFLDEGGNADKVDRVIFVVFLEKDRKVYEELMQAYFPPVPWNDK